MRIVQVFPGKVWGGAEQYVLDLGRALVSCGHDVIYLCRDAEAVTSRLDAECVGYHLLTNNILSHVNGADVVHIHDSKFVVPFVKATKKCDGEKPRVVFTRHIARASRVLPWRWREWRRLHSVVFVSEIAKRLWCGANGWMPQDKCTVIHNSIPERDAVEAAAPSLRELYGISSDVPLLMFTGRVRKSKGCAVIIEALSRLDARWAMVFVGASKPHDYHARLMELARRKGIGDRVYFYGFTSDVRQLVSQADIGLQPSIVREAFGLSQLEFMQAGKPIVTTDNGAQPEYVVNGRTGLLIPPCDPVSLAGAVGRLLDNYPDGCREMGVAAARQYRNMFSYEIFLKRIIAVYDPS